MIKIPATEAGLPAITEATALGISVNVTLIFSIERYRKVMEAYLTGLEQASKAGRRPGHASVRSPRSSCPGWTPRSTSGWTSSAVTRPARSAARPASPTPGWPTRPSKRSSPATGWESLAGAGAHPQRPLWASTGVKDPAYDDTMYVTELVAPNTVNTMPEATLNAVADHGVIAGATANTGYHEARGVVAQLSELGIELDEVTELLEVEGVQKFMDSWSILLEGVDKQLRAGAKKAGK